MTVAAPETFTPRSSEEAAATLADLAQADRRPVLLRGGGTKVAWSPVKRPVAVLATAALSSIKEHNAGDFTVVVGAGLTLLALNEELTSAGQMLAMDPPLGPVPEDSGATVGGILASNDSGPLRHRYGSMRDLVLGVTVALSDGTVARSGGKVIKNVAGYDLGKLFTGSHGTLGLVTQIALRLHPRPDATATLSISGAGAGIAKQAIALAAMPLEADALDVTSEPDGTAGLSVRFAGRASRLRAEQARAHLHQEVSAEIWEDDSGFWRDQAERQRKPTGVVMKVAATVADLEPLIGVATRTGAALVSRAGLGLSWLSLDDPARTAELRSAVLDAVPAAHVTVQDGMSQESPGASAAPAARAVEERLRRLFDPSSLFRSS